MIRIIARAESEDFVHWDNEQIIIEPPEGALFGDQSYGMSVRLYQGIYLGFLNHFNAIDGHIRPVLAWSYDGIHFKINYENFLLECDRGQWDSGMILSGEILDGIGDRLCMYYGGTDLDHTKPDTELTGGIGRAWIREDGFVSLTGSEIITKPVSILKERLVLNMSGIISVELLAADGYTYKRTRAVGDHCRVVPDIDLTPYMGQNLRFKLDLRKGELYSLGLSSL